MKHKLDFVTNSSSSNFLLIDNRKDKKSPIKVTMTFDLEEDMDPVEFIENIEQLEEIMEGEDLGEDVKKKIEQVFKDGGRLINVPLNSYGEGIVISPCEKNWEKAKLPEGIEILGGIDEG